MVNTTQEIDTRGNLNWLMDYELLYGEVKSVDDAKDLLKSIPSISLLLYVAAINKELYMNDSGEDGQKTQNKLIKSLLRAKTDLTKRLIEKYGDIVNSGQWPTLFYRYSNLLLYELIFSNYNNDPIKELNITEHEKLVKACLIINGVVNQRIKIEEGEIDKAFDGDEIEQVLLPQFIYQKDYVSNTDYTNQLTRCIYFFRYLENSEFSPHVKAYYHQLGVQNYMGLAKMVIAIFSQLFPPQPGVGPVVKTIDNLSEPHNQGLVRLAIDPTNFTYMKDASFSQFRKQMFVLTPDNKLLLLDISFLIDQLYKVHVFGFNALMESVGYKDFLGVKADKFMEKIYLKKILEENFCFAKCFSGKELMKRDKTELIDFVIRQQGNLLFIEFKDIFLAAAAKDKGDKDYFFKSLDLKLLKSGKDAPKAIQQLATAIKYLDKHPSEFDLLTEGELDSIYPVVIYTDNAFGYDGINKVYKGKFRKLLDGISLKNYTVKDLTFINLSFFEITGDYIKRGLLDVFSLIDAFHAYTSKPERSLTPFEVFAAVFRKSYVTEDLGTSSFYREILAEILASANAVKE